MMTGWQKRWIRAAAALALLVVATAGTVNGSKAAERRVALVLGNGAYQRVPTLANPANDARAMAGALKGLGFTVVEGYDLGIDAMVERIHSFGQAADGSVIALVFYAGHGIQVAGRNYLLPVDAKLLREADLRREAVEVDEILAEARQAKQLRVVILDACRDNPFLAQMARSLGSRSALIGRGFARVEDVESDTLIAYATKADAVAADGSGGHSPYTAALLQHLTTPGLTIERFFGKVRDSVVESTQGHQQPFVYGSLGGNPIYLTEPPAKAAAAQLATEPGPHSRATAAATAAADATEMAFWDALKTSANPADYQAYLDTYPNGRFAALARVRARVRSASAEDSPPNSPAAAASSAASASRMVGTASEAPATTQVAMITPPSAYFIECARFAASADQALCQRARDGEPVATATVASMLAAGRGVERDETAAARLYRVAADRGNTEAENGLAQLLEDGRGVPADPASARKLYRLAADQGHAGAQYNLGVMLELGHGGARDEAGAAGWYRLAAQQGNTDAQVTLGLMQEQGRGGARDLAEAARLYRLAADQGNPLGQAYLAAMLEQGRGLPRDEAEALRYYRLAAAQGNALALAAVKRLSP